MAERNERLWKNERHRLCVPRRARTGGAAGAVSDIPDAGVVFRALRVRIQPPHWLHRPALVRPRRLSRHGRLRNGRSGQIVGAAARNRFAGRYRGGGAAWLSHRQPCDPAAGHLFRDDYAGAGADDVIFRNLAGNVAESAVANVLWESDGKFFTPPLSSGCLPGITRALLIENFGVAELDITPAELQSCGASYLLSSVKGIRPINRYNNTTNQSSAIGSKLISEFNDWVWSKLAL